MRTLDVSWMLYAEAYALFSRVRIVAARHPGTLTFALRFPDGRVIHPQQTVDADGLRAVALTVAEWKS